MFMIIFTLFLSSSSRHGLAVSVKFQTQLLTSGVRPQYFLKTVSSSPLGRAISISSCRAVVLIWFFKHSAAISAPFFALSKAPSPPFFSHFCFAKSAPCSTVGRADELKFSKPGIVFTASTTLSRLGSTFSSVRQEAGTKIDFFTRNLDYGNNDNSFLHVVQSTSEDFYFCITKRVLSLLISDQNFSPCFFFVLELFPTAILVSSSVLFLFTFLVLTRLLFTVSFVFS